MVDEPRDYIEEAEGILRLPGLLRDLLLTDRDGTIKQLFAFLNIEDVMQRKSAVYALGQIGDPLAIEQLELCLQKETTAGIKDAIKASIATLKKMPAGRGYSELERRQYITDVYRGRIDDKRDVNEWRWRSESANADFNTGTKEVTKAIMLRKMKGFDDPEIQSEIGSFLKNGISLIERSVSIETPPHPLAYRYLAIAFAELGNLLFFTEENVEDVTPGIKAVFDKAVANGKKADELYDQSTGWDPGGRFDFHVSMANVHLLGKEFGKARQEIDKAKRFNSDSALFTEEANLVQYMIEKLKKGRVQGGESLKRPTTKGGCLSGAIVASSVVVLLMILLLIMSN